MACPSPQGSNKQQDLNSRRWVQSQIFPTSLEPYPGTQVGHPDLQLGEGLSPFLFQLPEPTAWSVVFLQLPLPQNCMSRRGDPAQAQEDWARASFPVLHPGDPWKTAKLLQARLEEGPQQAGREAPLPLPP